MNFVPRGLIGSESPLTKQWLGATQIFSESTMIQSIYAYMRKPSSMGYLCRWALLGPLNVFSLSWPHPFQFSIKTKFSSMGITKDKTAFALFVQWEYM